MYQERALAYAERYGIVDYKVEKNLMIYLVSFGAYLNNPRYTMKRIVNLDTGEVTSIRLKRYSRKGEVNR